MTIQEIIASNDARTIANAMMQLGEAYLKVLSTEDRPNPRSPWAKMNGAFFIYSTDPDAIAELEAIVESHNTSKIKLG